MEWGVFAVFFGAFADADTKEGVSFPFLILGFPQFDFLLFIVFYMLGSNLLEGGEFIWGYP